MQFVKPGTRVPSNAASPNDSIHTPHGFHSSPLCGAVNRVGVTGKEGGRDSKVITWKRKDKLREQSRD